MTNIEEQKIEVGLERLKNESDIKELIHDIHQSIDKLLEEGLIKNPSKSDNDQPIAEDKKT